MSKIIKQDLASAYQIIALLKMDDHTYTHLSSRSENIDHYHIYPFGLRFEEVTPNDLLKVSLDGEVIEGSEFQYNRTGYIIHGNIYKNRPDINSIFHLHTPATVAVSAMKDAYCLLANGLYIFIKELHTIIITPWLWMKKFMAMI